MRKLIYILIGLITFTSCEKKIPDIAFRIKSEGFSLEYADGIQVDSLPSLSHKVAGGLVSFIGEYSRYEFRTGKTSIEDYLFYLPPGEYQMEFRIPDASFYGQKRGSFNAEPTMITLSEQMDTVSVKVKANCSLLLVRDESNQMENGVYIIERFASGEGYFRSHPLTLDSISGFYYAYFTPDPDPLNPSAYIWFYDRKPGIESGGLSTLDFETGYQYVIDLLD